MLRSMYGKATLKKESATNIRDLALGAIANLTSILQTAKDELSGKEYESLVRAVGGCIGHIQHQILSKIVSEHPDLDDLA